MQTTAELTGRQREIWSFVVEYVDQHGYPPTVREIGGAVGLASPKEWIEDTYTEIKAVEYHIEGQHQRHDYVPKCLHDQYPWPSSFPSAASLLSFRTTGPSRMV